jgi:hypothetical protein
MSTPEGCRTLLGVSQGPYRLGREFIQMGGERNEYLGSRESISERVMLSVNGKCQAPGELIERARRGWCLPFECQ